MVENLNLLANDHSAETQRRAGLLADLQYGRIDEILSHGLHAFHTSSWTR